MASLRSLREGRRWVQGTCQCCEFRLHLSLRSCTTSCRPRSLLVWRSQSSSWSSWSFTPVVAFTTAGPGKAPSALGAGGATPSQRLQWKCLIAGLDHKGGSSSAVAAGQGQGCRRGACPSQWLCAPLEPRTCDRVLRVKLPRQCSPQLRKKEGALPCATKGARSCPSGRDTRGPVIVGCIWNAADEPSGRAWLGHARFGAPSLIGGLRVGFAARGTRRWGNSGSPSGDRWFRVQASRLGCYTISGWVGARRKNVCCCLAMRAVVVGWALPPLPPRQGESNNVRFLGHTSL